MPAVDKAYPRLVSDRDHPRSVSIGSMKTVINPKPPNPIAMATLAASTTSAPRPLPFIAELRCVPPSIGSALVNWIVFCLLIKISL
jgi:hypothetical protein